MDGNRDEAEKCIDIAEMAFYAGNIEKAKKFIHKAENLFPTQKAKELLKRMEHDYANNFSNTKNANSDGIPRKRNHFSPDSGIREEEEKVEANYTKDQLMIVNKIKRCRDYYQVLGVTKESSDSDIKKAYKKLALQLHPDKNNAPGASEAFKAVGNAVAVLTDPEKRKAYDLYGSDGPVTSHRVPRQHSNYEYAYTRGFESDVTAEELFYMFFGSGFSQHNTGSRRFQHQRHESNQQPSLAFGLILVLVVVSMMSSVFTPDPLYSLQQTSKYSVQRKTSNFLIPYYVKESFDTDYQGSIARLEISVEEEYISSMKILCFRERNNRDALMARARSFGNKAQFTQAQSLKTPSCDNLYRIGKFNY